MAPVHERAEAVIEAPPEVVWAVLSDFGDWPRWNRGVSRMEFNGSVEKGARFEWVGGGSRITSQIEEVQPCRRLVWSGRTAGIHAVHTWEFTASGAGTEVRTDESFEGLTASIFRWVLRRVLRNALRDGLEDLKAEAESRTGERTE